MNLPTLEQEIKKRAEEQLDRDIQEASDNFQNFLSGQKGLFRIGISLCLLENDNKTYPYLTQIISCEFVRKKIKEYCLGEYIQREIDTILKQKE